VTLDDTKDAYFRKQALAFLRVCLACVLHLPNAQVQYSA
jgi:hypothetical protein